MQREVTLGHRVEFGRHINLYKKLFIISASLFLIFSIIIGFEFYSSADATKISEWMLIIFILSLVSSVVFPLLILQARSKLKHKGSFEEIDVIENKIIYNSEKLGQKVYEPINIKSINIWKYSSRGGDNTHVITISLNNSDELFKVPNLVSNYADLVSKIKKFKEENAIPDK